MSATLGADRDALAMLGLLALAYVAWDPPIEIRGGSSGRTEFTHYHGLNIRAFIVDNLDGEVLGIGMNSIHRDENPVSHAEPAALAAAVRRIREKRPRAGGVSVESYYRGQMFYAPGVQPDDFITKGCTLYTSLEPCPMCTATLCVSRMKRVVHLIPDFKFGGSYDGHGHDIGQGIHSYYPTFDLEFRRLEPQSGVSPIASLVAVLHRKFSMELQRLRAGHVQETLFLDHLHFLLQDAFNLLRLATPGDSATAGPENANYALTLAGLRRVCGIP